MQDGSGIHVHPVVSGEVENIVCSQPSTCLTCWPWRYSVHPCHRMTSVTHASLSSLHLQPTVLLLTHWHTFYLTVLVCHPSVCSPLSVSCFTFLLLSLLQGLNLKKKSFYNFCSHSRLLFSLSPSLIPLLLFLDLPWRALVGSRLWQLY